MKDWLVRANTAVGISGYLATVTLTAGLLVALALLVVSMAGADGWSLLLLAFLGLFISVDAAITLVNRVVTARFGPAVLPGLAPRWCFERVPYHRCHADAAHEQRSHRRTHRAVGNPLSRESGWRYPVCAPVGLDRLINRERGR